LDITLLDKTRDAVLFLAALILSVSVHEFGHALVATKLGDPLPASQGRLSLSPMRHIDLVGTIIFPLVMFFASFPLLGWGRPVETDRSRYTRRLSPATGNLLVSLAGPFMNLVLAGVVSLLLLLAARAGLIGAATFDSLFNHLVALNLLLLFLNLLPMPPLDGGAILESALPRSQQGIVRFLSRWGFIVLFGLSMFTPVIRVLLWPAGWAANVWQSLLFRMAGL
jgi:Zn-dependent protease